MKKLVLSPWFLCSCYGPAHNICASSLVQGIRGLAGLDFAWDGTVLTSGDAFGLGGMACEGSKNFSIYFFQLNSGVSNLM